MGTALHVHTLSIAQILCIVHHHVRTWTTRFRQPAREQNLRPLAARTRHAHPNPLPTRCSRGRNPYQGHHQQPHHPFRAQPAPVARSCLSTTNLSGPTIAEQSLLHGARCGLARASQPVEQRRYRNPQSLSDINEALIEQTPAAVFNIDQHIASHP